MEKTFTYHDINDDEFVYIADNEELLDVVVDFVYEVHFGADKSLEVEPIKKGIKSFIEENDLLDKLVDDYESDLKDYFRDIAYDEYKRG